MAGSWLNELFKYLILCTSIDFFVSASEYFNDDISKVFRGMVDQNPDDIRFFAYSNEK